jgi:amino acid permease
MKKVYVVVPVFIVLFIWLSLLMKNQAQRNEYERITGTPTTQRSPEENERQEQLRIELGYPRRGDN